MDQNREGDPDHTITAPTPPQGRKSGGDAAEEAVEVVDLNDEGNVGYWCTRWQISPEQLRKAVVHAGANDAPAVSFALGREAP